MMRSVHGACLKCGRRQVIQVHDGAADLRKLIAACDVCGAEYSVTKFQHTLERQLRDEDAKQRATERLALAENMRREVQAAREKRIAADAESEKFWREQKRKEAERIDIASTGLGICSVLAFIMIAIGLVALFGSDDFRNDNAIGAAANRIGRIAGILGIVGGIMLMVCGWMAEVGKHLKGIRRTLDRISDVSENEKKDVTPAAPQRNIPENHKGE